MYNIAIVGLDFVKVKKISKQLAIKLNYQLIDVGEVFDEFLIKSIDFPIGLVDKILQQKESELLRNLSTLNNVILCVPADMFLSNKNYEILNNSCKILINKKNIKKTEENIQKLIKNYCNFEFFQEKLNYLDIIKIIRG